MNISRWIQTLALSGFLCSASMVALPARADVSLTPPAVQNLLDADKLLRVPDVDLSVARDQHRIDRLVQAAIADSRSGGWYRGAATPGLPIRTWAPDGRVREISRLLHTAMAQLQANGAHPQAVADLSQAISNLPQLFTDARVEAFIPIETWQQPDSIPNIQIPPAGDHGQL